MYNAHKLFLVFFLTSKVIPCSQFLVSSTTVTILARGRQEVKLVPTIRKQNNEHLLTITHGKVPGLSICHEAESRISQIKLWVRAHKVQSAPMDATTPLEHGQTNGPWNAPETETRT